MVDIYARIAQSAYTRNKPDRQKLIDQYYPDWKLVDKYSDKHHTVFENGDRMIVGIRGTDFSNSQKGKAEDLVTDAFLTLGLEGLTGRYKKSDKHVKKIIDENPGKTVKLVAHSLGGRIANDLGMKYDIETHAFAPGTTHIHAQKNILKFYPGMAEKIGKHHIYITDGGDPISTAAYLDQLSTVHVTPMRKLPKKKRGVLQSHSIWNWINDNKPVRFEAIM